MSESKNWRPSKWTEEAIRRRVKRVYRVAQVQLSLLIGPHAGNIIMAELIGNMQSDQSRDELHRRGFRVIGDL
jgi:hypothetical protein